MIQKLLEYRFKRRGWKFSGQLPKRQKRCIVLVAPHTSDEDFFIGLAVAGITNYPISYLVDRKRFNFFSRPFLKLWKAIPYNPVDELALGKLLEDEFKKRNQWIVALAPQTGQTEPGKWNTGFYDYCFRSNIAIALAGMDYRRKIVKFHSWFNLSGDKERDLNYIRNFFTDINGKNPEKSLHRSDLKENRVLKRLREK